MPAKIDKLVRSNRKTVAILVHPDGQVTVRAPKQVPLAQIQAFVESKAEWIEKKQAIARQKRESKPTPRRFVEGENFLYTGKEYPLVVCEEPGKPLTLEGDRFVLRPSPRYAPPEVFYLWYERQAHTVIKQRVEALAQKFNLRYTKIRITSARTRWGSCSSTGTLSFSWRLIMAPPEVIDYVVIHELAHTAEPNHSKRFWDRVAAMDPGYVKHVKWLKENGHRLVLE